MSSREHQDSDPILQRLVEYAVGFAPGMVDAVTRHQAKVRVIDTLGALYGGLDSAVAVAARQFAAQAYPAETAAVLGVPQRTTLDVAAFVNATTARCAEMNDTFHRAGRPGAHPSDVITPLLGVAEARTRSCADLLTAVVLSYEVFLTMAEATNLTGFDYTTLVVLGTAVGAGWLMDLDADAMRNCVSIAVVANNPLRRARIGRLSMWKSGASGHAGRSGVFAAMLASSGIDGPTDPYTGRAGWLECVAGEDVVLGALGGADQPFKLGTTILKPRGACGTAIPAILAAERAYEGTSGSLEIDKIVVETYEEARFKLASGPHHWDPRTPESADHSIPYVVAATLVDGTTGPAQFDEAHLADPAIRRLMAKVEVVENPDFTALYDTPECLHRTRIRVRMSDGGQLVGETGGEFGDISDPMSDDAVAAKFRSVAGARLASDQLERLEAALWSCDDLESVAELVNLLVPESGR